MSVPYLKLNFCVDVPLQIYDQGVYMAPDSHSVTVGLSGARRKPFIQWYLKGWCQGYFKLHHTGNITAEKLSNMLHQVGDARKFRLETSFSDMMPLMCEAMDDVVAQLTRLSGVQWSYSSSGAVQGTTLSQRLQEMDTFVAKHTDLKIENII